MNKGKIGLLLVILGNILYWLYTIFGGNDASTMGEFSSGLLLGLSVGINLVGIILLAIYISKGNLKR